MRVGWLKMAIFASFVHCLPNNFSARQHAELAICYRKFVRQSVRLSVCPSVTRVDQSKTLERIIEILSPSDRPNILVFRHQKNRKSDGFTPNGAQNTRG